MCEPLLDCNENGIPDRCDVADGTSDDCNGNGVPDECCEQCNASFELGACCLGDICVPTTVSGCLEAGGTYGGQSVICGTINCGNTCAADLDRDGFVTFSDLMIILAAWGNCPD